MFYLVWVVVVGILVSRMACGADYQRTWLWSPWRSDCGHFGITAWQFLIWIDWDIRLWFVGASNNVRYRCHRPALVDSVNQESLAETIFESMPFGLEPAL
jgi:hypothetical protein